jgi:hypothetical protein
MFGAAAPVLPYLGHVPLKGEGLKHFIFKNLRVGHAGPPLPTHVVGREHPYIIEPNHKCVSNYTFLGWF